MYSRLRPFRVLENVPRSKIVELLQVQSVQYCRVSVSFENRSLVNRKIQITRAAKFKFCQAILDYFNHGKKKENETPKLKCTVRYVDDRCGSLDRLMRVLYVHGVNANSRPCFTF